MDLTEVRSAEFSCEFRHLLKSEVIKALRAFRPAGNEIGDLFIDMRFSVSVF